LLLRRASLAGLLGCCSCAAGAGRYSRRRRRRFVSSICRRSFGSVCSVNIVDTLRGGTSPVWSLIVCRVQRAPVPQRAGTC